MRFAAVCLGLTALSVAGAASAEVDLISPRTVQGTITVGGATSDGPTSWTHGGFGKAAFGRGTFGTADADVVWQPQFTDSLSLVVDGVAQRGVRPSVDVAEAYVLWRPLPTSATRVQARLGMLYVPVSLEHDSTPGEPWGVRDTLTPSAINSWVGEEVKVLAAEGTVERTFTSLNLQATLAAFSHNDTAGTLIALRGWSFSDVVATASGRMTVPPRSDYADPQSPQTQPFRRLDDRLGVYGRVRLSHARGTVDLTAYDNNAELGAGQGGQWGWRTRFYNLGVTLPLGPTTTVSGQALDGHTDALVGGPGGYRYNLDFRSAYLRLTEHRGSETLTGRVDLFETRSNHLSPGDLFYHPGPPDLDETYSENGWAGLGAWRHALAPGRAVTLEWLHVTWKRAYMAAFETAPHQHTDTLRAAYQLSF